MQQQQLVSLHKEIQILVKEEEVIGEDGEVGNGVGGLGIGMRSGGIVSCLLGWSISSWHGRSS